MPLNDIAIILTDPEFLVPLNIQRPEQGRYEGSEYIRGEEPTELSIRAAVMPLTRLALKTTFPFEQNHVLPEGVRQESSIIVISPVELKASDEQTPGDRIVGYRGATWEVFSVERWDDHNFWSCIASKLPPSYLSS